MKFFYATSVIALLLVGSGRCKSEGFLNLNFESANVSGYSPGTVPTQDAFPDWSVYYGPTNDPTYSGSISVAGYDALSTGGPVASLVDSNALAPYGPIQGEYSALLQSLVPAAGTASIGQTGTVPNNAQSLIFLASGSLDVSFNGQALSFTDISNAVNYTVYAANISSYAGQTGQLLFTAPVQTSTVFDNIQFSTSPVPEPSTFGLCVSGGLSLAWRRRKKSSK